MRSLTPPEGKGRFGGSDPSPNIQLSVLCCHLVTPNEERFRLLPHYFGACQMTYSYRISKNRLAAAPPAVTWRQYSRTKIFYFKLLSINQSIKNFGLSNKLLPQGPRRWNIIIHMGGDYRGTGDASPPKKMLGDANTSVPLQQLLL